MLCLLKSSQLLHDCIKMHLNKVSPWRDVTLLARRVLPPGWVTLHRGCYRRRQTMTTDVRRVKQFWPPTLCVGGPVISWQ